MGDDQYIFVHTTASFPKNWCGLCSENFSDFIAEQIAKNVNVMQGLAQENQPLARCNI